MKRLTKAATLIAGAALAFAVTPPAFAADIAIDETNFPDAAFRAEVKAATFNDGNDTLTEAEIATATSINVTDKGIENLKGIELFPNLTELLALKNKIASLDLSKNTKIKTLM